MALGRFVLIYEFPSASVADVTWHFRLPDVISCHCHRGDHNEWTYVMATNYVQQLMQLDQGKNSFYGPVTCRLLRRRMRSLRVYFLLCVLQKKLVWKFNIQLLASSWKQITRRSCSASKMRRRRRRSCKGHRDGVERRVPTPTMMRSQAVTAPSGSLRRTRRKLFVYNDAWT